LAGALAVEWELLPWNEPNSDPIVVAREAFALWLESQGNQKTEDQKILQSVSDFISKYGESRFSALFGSDKSIYQRMGWYKDAPQGRIYLISRESLEEICKFDINRIGKAFKKANWIVEMDSGRLTKKTRMSGGGFKYLYYLRAPEEPDDAN
jgi:putative DNA primase/helicase